MMRHKQFFEKFDLVVALISLIFGLTVISLYLISATIYLVTLGLAISLASLIYLLIWNKKENKSENYRTKKEKILYELLFFVVFSMSLYILNISEGRPPIYFILISACTGLLAISIFCSETKSNSLIQILKIFMLSFNIKYSIYYFFGGIPGIDSVVHAKMNDLLSQVGNINVLSGKEPYFPIMHVEVAITEILTSTGIKDASNFAIIIPLVLSTIFVFLVARDLFGEKIGLLAMLIVNVTDFHIYWGSAPQTTTFGIILYYLLLFTLSKVISPRNNIKWDIISLILISTIILTHAVSSFIFLTTLIGLLMGSIIYKIVFDRNESVYLGKITLITGIALLQHWFVALYSKGGRPFFDVVASTLHYYITGHSSLLDRPETYVGYATYLPPFIERFADTTGLAILLFFSLMGCLFWLSSKYRNKLNFSLIVCIILLLGITFSFPLFGLRNIIPSRWFAFEYFFLSIMAAFSIIKISKLFNWSYAKKIFVVMILFSLSFFMISSTISNVDSPLWLKESTISTTYTLKEVKGAETLSKYSDNLISDNRYGGSVLSVYLGIKESSFKSERDLFKSENKIFIWRNYMLDRPIRWFMRLEGYYKRIEEDKILGSEFLDKLERYDKNYDNGDVSGYYLQ